MRSKADEMASLV